MSQIIDVVYENGVLRPLHPLKWDESRKVRLMVLPDLPEVPPEIRKQIQELAAGGKISEPPLKGKIEPVSEEAREKLAEEIGKMPGKSLSEIIIEQRGPW